MVYYRVKPEYDQTPRLKDHTIPRRRTPCGIFVANELYTDKELSNFYLPERIKREMFTEIVIKKTETYWFFGCRFEKGVNWYDK